MARVQRKSWKMKFASLLGNTREIPTYKLVIVGDGGVGKSALTIQYFQKLFITNYDPTIEDSYVQHTMVDGEVCILDDTAGQEEYSAMREQYMRSGGGFLIVYSVTDTRSFARVAEFYHQVLRVQDVDSFPVLLVANKIDLVHSRKISPRMGKKLANELGIEYMETSAKDPPVNVSEAFEEAVRIIKVHPTTKIIQQRLQDRYRSNRMSFKGCVIS